MTELQVSFQLLLEKKPGSEEVLVFRTTFSKIRLANLGGFEGFCERLFGRLGFFLTNTANEDKFASSVSTMS